jgi:hypothetical protein
VIATADGLIDLYDVVTNIEAKDALRLLDLCIDQDLDLSAGDRFPWALWVHRKQDIMKCIRDSRGVTRFAAIDFSFFCEELLVIAQAFQIDLEGSPSLALIVLDGDLFIKPLTTNSSTGSVECQWLLDRLAAELQTRV